MQEWAKIDNDQNEDHHEPDKDEVSQWELGEWVRVIEVLQNRKGQKLEIKIEKESREERIFVKNMRS